MPVNTDSSQWESGTEPVTMELQILDFLMREPDKAYSPDEIADELFDRPYSKVAQYQQTVDSLEDHRQQDEITEEEAELMKEFADTRSDIKDAAERLDQLGLIEARIIEETPVEVTYFKTGRTMVYTYAGRRDD